MQKKCLLNLIVAAAMTVARLSFATNASYTNAVMADHPVAFWPLNETSGTVIHDVFNTNNGTVMNPGGLTLGAPGILYSNGLTSDTAISFKGSPGGSGFIVAPSSSSFSSNVTDPSQITIEGWFKLPATFPGGDPNLCIISCDTSCPQGWAWIINNSSTANPIPQGWLAQHVGWQSLNFGFFPNQWVYYVMTYDGTTLKLYTNGVNAGSVACGYNPAQTFDRGPLMMGAYDNTCPAIPIIPGRYYQGEMENIAFYNYALTPTQITNHYYYGKNNIPFGQSPPSTSGPGSQTNYVTQTANFTVTASGTSPFYYQWCAGTTGTATFTNLIAGGQYSAVTNSSLSISSLTFSNAGDFVVVVTNAYGSTTSSVATLTILDGKPFISAQPSNRTNYLGETAVLSVGAGGVMPLAYQWQAGVTGVGVYSNLNASSQMLVVTNATLAISNVALANAGDYRVVISNTFGSITSSIATLLVSTNPSYDSVVMADSPVSYWPMQETAGPTIHDIAGTNHGTLYTSTDGTSLVNNQHTNFVVGDAVASDGATYRLAGPGRVAGDKALYFTNLNGSVNNSQVVIPYNSALDPATDFSAEAWVNVPAYPIGYTKNNYQTVMGIEANSGSTQNGWWMNLQTDNVGSSKGTFQFNLAKPPGSTWNSPASAPSFNGKWVHAVEVCIGGTNLICYTNGVQMYNMVWPTNNYMSEGAYGTHKLPFIIGSYCVSYVVGNNASTGFERGNFWHGGISHVAIYNYPLSAARIQAHYQAGFTVPPPPPPTVSVQPSGGNISVIFANGFLQQATSLTGPWTDVLPTNQTSPYVTGATNPALFFRVSTQP